MFKVGLCAYACMKFVASFSGSGGCDGQRHPSLADGKMPSLRDGRGMQAHCYRPAGQARVRLEVLSVAKNSIVPFQRNVSELCFRADSDTGT